MRAALLLWLGALVVSGFTADRHLDPFDEGLLLLAAQRMAAGEVPYADFQWAYGPGQLLPQWAWFELVGPSVVPWRVLRVVADASAALLVALLARPAGARWAVAAGVAAAAALAQPTSANPAIPAFALALGALLAATRGRPALAGVLVAVTGFWRPDFGLFALVAVMAALVARGRPDLRRAGIAAAGAGALLYLPFVLLAGVGTLWESLVAASLRDGAAWRLDLPLVYDGPLRTTDGVRAFLEDAKDALGFEVPLLATLALALAAGLGVAAAVRARRPDPYRAREPGDPEGRAALAGALVLGAGMLLYFLGRADDSHQQPLVAAACVAAPLAATRAPWPRAVRLMAGGLLAALLVAGVANRASALLLPPPLERVTLPGVPGIAVPPDEARALPRLVREVRRLVPAGEPIYVAPRRSDRVTLTAPLIHVLARRPNVLDRDVVLLGRAAEQRRVVAALRRARPRVVVRWLDPASSRPEPNERGRGGGARILDRHLSAAYRPAGRYGAYAILRRR